MRCSRRSDGSEDIVINSCEFSVTESGGASTQDTCASGTVVQTAFGTEVGVFRSDKMNVRTPTGGPGNEVPDGRLRASFNVTAFGDTDRTNTTTVYSATLEPDLYNNSADVDIHVVGADGSLPETGANPGRLVNIGLAFLLGGLMLVALGGRKRPVLLRSP